jgi:glycine cleavage system aminomethyltransferase T
MDPIGKATLARPSSEDGMMAADHLVTIDEAHEMYLRKFSSLISKDMAFMRRALGVPNRFTPSNPQDWEDYRGIFTALYKESALPLPKVKCIMEHQYGFVAS